MLPFLAMPAAYCLAHVARCLMRRDWVRPAAWAAFCAALYAALWWPASGYTPNRAYWHYLRATRYAIADDLPRYAGELEKAYACNSDDPNIVFKFGRARMHQRRFADAARLFERALMMKPDFFNGWSDLGWVMIELGKYEQAQQAFTVALRLSPNSDNDHRGLGIAMERRGLSPDQQARVWASLQGAAK